MNLNVMNKLLPTYYVYLVTDLKKETLNLKKKIKIDFD